MALKRTFSVYDVAIAVLKTINPVSVVSASIGVGVLALSVFLVQVVFAFVATSVFPCVDTASMHHPLVKGANEVTTVSPFELSDPRHFILLPLSIVPAPVCPVVHAMTLFKPI